MQPPSTQLKDFSDFATSCKHFGIEINNNQLNLFKKYYEILVSWNEKINLISRKDTSLPTILERHFLDSIIFTPEISTLIQETQSSTLNPQSYIFDIGSGGGFPGIPLAIVNPTWKFVLCDSIKKKSTVLLDLISKLDLTSQIKILNERVETINHKKEHHKKFDLVTARAVEKLSTLVKYSEPLLKEGGSLLAYKAEDIEDELESLGTLIKREKIKVTIFEKEVSTIKRKLICVKKQ